MDRPELLEKVRRWKLFEPMLKSEAWQIYLVEMEARRDRRYRMLLDGVDHHARMSKHAGAVEALDDVLAWADRVVRDGTAAVTLLNKRAGNTSSDEE